jgi:hypothetical protein
MEVPENPAAGKGEEANSLLTNSPDEGTGNRVRPPDMRPPASEWEATDK